MASEDAGQVGSWWDTWLGALALFAAVVLAHVAGTAVVYQFNHLTSSGEVFFPAAGVTMAALLLVRRRRWWVVLLATLLSEFIADLILGEVVLTAIGSALANSVEPALGALLVQRLVRGRIDLNRRHHLDVFVLAAILAALIGALVGATATRFTPGHSPFWSVFGRWTTADALGILIVGALILAWLAPIQSAIRSRYAVAEAFAFTVTCLVITRVTFWNWSPGLAYLTLVPLGWAAVRFGIRGATAAVAMIAAISEWATNSDHGLFAVVSHNHTNALWLLQLFLGVAILGGLVIAASVAEISRTEAALRISESAEHDARLAAVEAQTAERNRLARELHDSVSQALFSMTMHTRTAQLAIRKTGLPDDSLAAVAVDRLRTLTAGALAEMRALIFELRPGALAEEGLVSALRRQATAISAREGLQIRLNAPDHLPLSANAEEHCYRVLLEAWNNTVKHAHARTITTTITVDDGVVRAQAVDDGCGFDPSADRQGHLGLRTMRERAGAIGASFDLSSRPGHGTAVCIQLADTPSKAAPRVGAGGGATR